jgi:hypothetical protein
MRKEIDTKALRIMTQYWSGSVRVCELERAGDLLDVHVSQPTNDEWLVEAHSNHASDAVVVTGRGATRAAAFSALASAWTAQATNLGLREFDWKTIGDVLRSVSAID